MGPEQWLNRAPRATIEGLEYAQKSPLGDIASVTEQTGAWVPFDSTGPAMQYTCERQCAVPFRSMMAGDTHRTVIHHLGCFVIVRKAKDHNRILGPHASAGTLHRALITAAQSLS
jgi:sarcosine oxidase subunit gamma